MRLLNGKGFWFPETKPLPLPDAASQQGREKGSWSPSSPKSRGRGAGCLSCPFPPTLTEALKSACPSCPAVPSKPQLNYLILTCNPGFSAQLLPTLTRTSFSRGEVQGGRDTGLALTSPCYFLCLERNSPTPMQITGLRTSPNTAGVPTEIRKWCVCAGHDCTPAPRSMDHQGVWTTSW